MADDKPKRWIPGKLDFNDIRIDPPELQTRIFEGKYPGASMGCKVPETPCPACEAGHEPTTKKIINADLSQLELRVDALYAARQDGLVSGQTMLEAAGLMIESPEGRRLAPLPDPVLSTHDAAHYNLPAVGERVVGVDFGDDGRSVLVMGVVKRMNEPNKNGDIFILEDVKVMDLPPGQSFKLEEPEYVGKYRAREMYEVGKPMGKFPPAKIKGTVTGRITNKEHLNRDPRKVMNKTAERIKMMTETYIKTYQGDPHHVPQTRDAQFEREHPLQTLEVPATEVDVRKLREEVEREMERWKQDPHHIPILPGPMPIQRVDERTPTWVLREVLAEIKERQDWLSTSENAPKLIEARELSREQYNLYRAQQRVEALLHQYEKEAESIMEREDIHDGEDLPEKVWCPRCDAPMVLREAGRGLMEGHKFYGCSHYPSCDATRTLNEVKEEYPKQWKVIAHIVEGEVQKRFQLGIFYGWRWQPLMGKRFNKTHFSGSHIFQDFIEPAARAAGSSLAAMVRATLETLNVKNAGVITRRMVKDIGAIDPIQTVDDIMLDKVLKETKLVQQFLGTKPKRTLFRINVEKRTLTKGDKRVTVSRDVLQLRAKDRKGQTIKTSEMPWDWMDDPYALEQMITEFCVATSEELGLGSGTWQGAEDVLDCLIKSTRKGVSSHSQIKHAVELINQVAMQINFRPKKTTPSRDIMKPHKLNKYFEAVVDKFNRVEFMPSKHEVSLRGTSYSGRNTEWVSADIATFDMRGAVRGLIDDLIEVIKSSDDIFKPIPTNLEILEACVALQNHGHPKADKIAQVAECRRDATKTLRSKAKNQNFTRNYGEPMVKQAFKAAVAMGMADKVLNKKQQIGNCVVFSIAHPKSGPNPHAYPKTDNETSEFELTYFPENVGNYYRCSTERTTDEKIVKDWLTRFATQVAVKHAVLARTTLERTLEEFKNAHPSHVNAAEKTVLVSVCQKLIDNIIDLDIKKERPLSEIAPHAWSQGTEKFIEEQKKLAPQREKERLERVHKAQEDARKLEKKTKLYEPGYCKKCDRTGCMCPRPINPNAPEHHPLHGCKDGKHVRTQLVPRTQFRDLGVHSETTNLRVCLDCFELIEGSRPTGRKLSTLDAPQDS